LLFGAHFEDILGRDSVASPGDIIATRYGAICRKTVDGAVWVSHLKRKVEGAKFFKLPATTVLPGELLAGTPEIAIPPSFTGEYRTFKEIWYKEKNGVGYLFFEFHNGAMSTEQCKRLEAAVHEIRRRPTKVLVFMGGVNFWSNGIHLNVIEAAPDPAIESWNNINAMDDLVLAILTTCDRLTIAALRANAGAGGAMMPLACDRIIVRDGVVLNPHYQSMGLYGSEYWTYSLPKRVGPEKALGLTRDCLPINAGTAAKIGMIDAVTDADRRRWLLPPDNREQEVKLTVDAKFRGWYHWEVPFDTDPDWPKALQDSVTAYRAAWRTKMDEVNALHQGERRAGKPGGSARSAAWSGSGFRPVQRRSSATAGILS
jgi:putative two-component system protein, hydrogenase maturation factor HypX/HoxX